MSEQQQTENQYLIDSPTCHEFIDSILSSDKESHNHSGEGGVLFRLISTSIFFFC
jgi:hypothetical protein